MPYLNLRTFKKSIKELEKKNESLSIKTGIYGEIFLNIRKESRTMCILYKHKNFQVITSLMAYKPLFPSVHCSWSG